MVEPGQVNTAMTGLFKEQPEWAAPRPGTFVKSAIKKLGFGVRTCGYWAHSFQNWLGITWLLPQWALASLILRTGTAQYEYAMKRKRRD